MIAVIGLTATDCLAQVSIQLTSPHKAYLLFEAIPITIKIENDSALELPVGRYESAARLWLKLDYRREEPDIAPVMPPKELSHILKPGKAYLLKVNLAVLFDVRKARRYTVTTYLDWRGRRYSSASVVLGVVNGLEISTERRGLPMRPEIVREYSLRYIERGGGEHLILSVSNREAGRCLAVFDLGPMMRLYKPILRFDRTGNLRVVHHMDRNVNAHSYLISDEKSVRFLERVHKTTDGQDIPDKSTNVRTSAAGSGANEE